MVSIPILPAEKSAIDSVPLGQVLHHIGDKTFYMQWDRMGGSTLHYYGPYHGFDEITKVLGLSLKTGRKEPKPGGSPAPNEGR